MCHFQCCAAGDRFIRAPRPAREPVLNGLLRLHHKACYSSSGTSAAIRLVHQFRTSSCLAEYQPQVRPFGLVYQRALPARRYQSIPRYGPGRRRVPTAVRMYQGNQTGPLSSWTQRIGLGSQGSQV